MRRAQSKAKVIEATVCAFKGCAAVANLSYETFFEHVCMS